MAARMLERGYDLAADSYLTTWSEIDVAPARRAAGRSRTGRPGRSGHRGPNRSADPDKGPAPDNKGEKEHAVRVLENLFDREPTRSDTAFALVEIYRQLGDIALAKSRAGWKPSSGISRGIRVYLR